MQKKNLKANAKNVKAEAKTVAKEAEVKVVSEVKEEVKTAAAAEAKAVEEKPAAETKAAEKKPAKTKKAAAKPAKEPVKPVVVVQYQNNEIDVAQIEERIKAQFVAEGHKAGCIKKFNVYVKPEEFSAYYAINDKFYGRVDLF